MAADPNPAPFALTGDPVVDEAHERALRCFEWEARARKSFLEDLKFRHGDSDNGYQWPNAIKRARDVDSKPCLTINQIRQHNFQITNRWKQSKTAPKILATGGGASVQSAKMQNALIRRLEGQSNALDAYGMAFSFMVDGGYGAWRIVTDYCNPDSFDQDIYVLPIPDPLTVYLDPDAQQKDKSDARFGFVFDSMPEEKFEREYPKYKGLLGQLPLSVGTAGDLWTEKGHILLAEYYRKVPKRDELVEFRDAQTGARKLLRKSEMPEEIQGEILFDPQTRTREVWDTEVEWYLIAGNQIVDRTIWPGKFIPLIVCVGEETKIEGILDRKGHTRALKDAQRMYNYNASSQVEHVALQGKTPWKAPVAAIEEYETYWNTANTVNHSVLPYKHKDDEGEPIPPPERVEGPKESSAFETGMRTAFEQMMMASGQWQNQLGMMGNERTGKAIQERQDQSDTSVFHFQDSFESALRFTARQYIDLFPKIYDSERVLRVQDDDGVEFDLRLDPAAKQVLSETRGANEEIVERVLNPQLGRYDVEPGVGPAYGTKREQTAEALTLILTQAPALTGIIGDLLLDSLDFDKAKEAAQRLRRMVPSQALGIGPSQKEQQLASQVQSMQALLAKALEKHGKDAIALKGKDQMRDIDAYKAETDRFKALAEVLQVDPQGLQQVIHQLVGDALATHLTEILQANQAGVGEQSGSGAPSGAPLQGLGQTGLAPSEWISRNAAKLGRGGLRFGPLAQEHVERGVVQ